MVVDNSGYAALVVRDHRQEGMLLKSYRIAEGWKEASFIDRPNRFTLMLRSGRRQLRAYLPNTGRLEEYLVTDAPFFIIPHRTRKFEYRAVSTFYQGAYVLLDTIEMNSLVGALIKMNRIPGLPDTRIVHRERTIGSSRFDFYIEINGAPPLIL